MSTMHSYKDNAVWWGSRVHGDGSKPKYINFAVTAIMYIKYVHTYYIHRYSEFAIIIMLVLYSGLIQARPNNDYIIYEDNNIAGSMSQY